MQCFCVEWGLLAQVVYECGKTASRLEQAHIHTSAPGSSDLTVLGLCCACLLLTLQSHPGPQILSASKFLLCSAEGFLLVTVH